MSVSTICIYPELNMKLSIECPITMEPMVDPVTTPGGHTYERKNIERAILERGRSPLTNLPLAMSDLIPNRALKDLIDNQRNGNAVNSSTASTSASGIDYPFAVNTETALQQNQTTLALEISTNENQHLIRVVPQSAYSPPMTVALVIDISGSMSAPAASKDADGEASEYVLTQLQIVQHSANTIVNALRPIDEIILISYSTEASVVLERTAMDADGKKMATRLINNLHTEGCTNIWDGIEHALVELEKENDASRLNSVVLLTDGVPNCNPPRGIVKTLERFQEEHKVPCQIDTFGFGYQLETDLMKEIAEVGKGQFHFIPDGGLVGTVFINYLCNTLTTIATDICVEVKGAHGVVRGCENVKTESSDAVQVHLGSLCEDQSRSIVFEVESGHPEFTLTYNGFNGTVSDTFEAGRGPAWNSDTVQNELIRISFTGFLRSVMFEPDCTTRNAQRSAFKAATQFPRTEYGKAVCKDFEGEVTMALSTAEAYGKWGRHFACSMMFAHENCRCNNFKDPGVQMYGGARFRALQDAVEKMFLAIDAPKPKFVPRNGCYSAAPTTQFDMRSYMNASGGCFSGDGIVVLENGMRKRVCEVQRGDRICCADGTFATVRCVVETRNFCGELCHIGSLRITPWHPIRCRGEFIFPAFVAPIRVADTPETVYDFVLDAGHVALVSGIGCITLGHGIREPVAQHAYFGTERVLEDLQKLPGWELGLVSMEAECLERSSETGEVTGMVVEGHARARNRTTAAVVDVLSIAS